MLRLFSVLAAIFSLVCPPLIHAQADGEPRIHLMDVSPGSGGIFIPFGAEVVVFNNGLMKQCHNPVSYLQQPGITRVDDNLTRLDHTDHNSFTSHILLEAAADFTFTAQRPERESGDAILTWDPNIDVVAGYKVYFGTASRVYRPPIDVGNQTQYTVIGLDYGVRYYFAVTAYDFDGNESGYSNEVSKTIGVDSNREPMRQGPEGPGQT
ncbi:MAG: fibronectin type III domain-containing protein [Acidobacteriia bacterium]|nr:fibronectin type III domain-containing protein [Terriglobia bacterium]